MNNPIEAARTRLAAIEQEAEKLRFFIKSWEAVADLLEVSDEAVPNPEKAGEKAPAPETAPPARTRVVNPPTKDVVAAAIHILRKRGHPMSRRALHQELWRLGVEVRGSDPVKTLGTILWRATDDVVQLEGYGYWPKADAYSRADYPGVPRVHGPQEPARFR